MIVYIVTSGDYSDYHIEGVYSTMEKAEDASKLHASENSIAQWGVDETEQHPDGLYYFSVYIDKDGNSDGGKNVSFTYAHLRTDLWRPFGDGKQVDMTMWARDKEHAVKIANERRIGLLASGEWETNWGKWKEKTGGPK